jgi:site-specific DNA-cytosine methylase
MKILDLCAGTGAWSKPYVENGYDVILLTYPGKDVRELRGMKCRGVLAAPPCTMFCLSGNRWKRKTEEIIDALQIVDACLRIVEESEPEWWALENPAGILSRVLGKPKLKFHPWHYGDGYVKETWLWGDFNVPEKFEVPGRIPKVHLMAPGTERSKNRSITPSGFARAFYEANS